MKFLKFFWISVLFILFASACTIPARRVSTGVVLPRGVLMDAQSFQDGESYEKFQVSLGGGKGESFSDNGVVQFGSYFNGSFEFLPAPTWALGLRPYMGVNDRETTDRNHLDFEFYHRMRLVNSESFRFYLFNSFRSAENISTDSDVFCFFFCTSTGNEASKARIQVFEIVLAPIVEFFIDHKNSIALTPEILWRNSQSENRHSIYGSSQYKQSLFDYSLGLYYGARFGQNNNTLLQIGGGYKKRHGFGLAAGEVKSGFNVDLQLKFAFGGDKTNEDEKESEQAGL